MLNSAMHGRALAALPGVAPSGLCTAHRATVTAALLGGLGAWHGLKLALNQEFHFLNTVTQRWAKGPVPAGCIRLRGPAAPPPPKPIRAWGWGST